ncbi:RNA-guided endonuclease InsQ/TnpB family protein [Shimazuella kribbensis]|uniref:RNA-guided endonuclease InsQ/TnpB family protein n=1 Tax=Shimazuella kribbensis TaxID=139808 RepID=UPI0003FB0655|nr:RNA-guided endonuclease TnpB family protein [Shimazuella kribbensis]
METHYKTYQIRIKKGHRMYEYFQEMAQNSKKMYNTTNFYIRQVYSALSQKKELQPLQREVLATMEYKLDQMNEVQLAAYRKRVEREKKKPMEQRKEGKCNLFELPSEVHPYISYPFLDSLFKVMAQNDYRSLPTQTSQWVMKTVFQNWKSYFCSLQTYKKDPSVFRGRPKIPKYSRSNQKEVLFTNQDCAVKANKFLKFPKTKKQLNIGKLGVTEGRLKQVRILPKYGQYIVEIVVEVSLEFQERTETNCLMSIDLGIDNLATTVTNTGSAPLLVKGKHVKSINQYYNKRKAYYLSRLRQGKQPNEGPYTSKRLERIHQKRHQKLKDIFHKASSHIVNLAVLEKVDAIIIGRNKDWKQASHLGKRNNQSFVHIPHQRLIRMIEYKAMEKGIQVRTMEESYTSKASFLDHDEIPTYGESDTKQLFSGKRIKRGLYQTKQGKRLNADVNGAANILKKAYLYRNEDQTFDIQTVNVWNPQPKVV